MQVFHPTWLLGFSLEINPYTALFLHWSYDMTLGLCDSPARRWSCSPRAKPLGHDKLMKVTNATVCSLLGHSLAALPLQRTLPLPLANRSHASNLSFWCFLHRTRPDSVTAPPNGCILPDKLSTETSFWKSIFPITVSYSLSYSHVSVIF